MFKTQTITSCRCTGAMSQKFTFLKIQLGPLAKDGPQVFCSIDDDDDDDDESE